MVYTKHFPIKTFKNLQQADKYITDALKTSVTEIDKENIHLDNLFQYITNDNKTLEKHYVSSHGITSIEHAYEEFKMTKLRFEYLTRDNFTFNFDKKGYEDPTFSDIEKKGNVLARHFIQSFSPDDDLTPDQIHEIGRKTMLEFTGSEHEFVIATHVDKEHIHNHIIVNTTNFNTGKLMKWKIPRNSKGKQKDVSKLEFEKVSDRLSALYGAKIINKSPNNSHQKYTKWQTESIYKSKIKSRLDFLLDHSHSLTDFKQKAGALYLQVDFSGKWASYKLLDEPQIKNTRSRALSKNHPEKYNVDEIEKKLSQNEGIFSVDDVVQKYEEKTERQETDFDYQLLVEPWQVSHQTEKGYYINVDFGANEQSQIFVGAYKVDKLEDGNYHLYVKLNAYFYLMDKENAVNNKYITGRTLIKQMNLYNGRSALKKEPVMTKLNDVVDAINFLAKNDVKSGRQLTVLEDKLQLAFDEAKTTLGALNDKIIDLQQVGKALLYSEIGEDNHELMDKIKQLMPFVDIETISYDKIEQEIQAVAKSKSYLQEKLESINKEINLSRTIKAVSEKKEEQAQRPIL